MMFLQYFSKLQASRWVLVNSLHLMLNKSLSTVYFPDIWKESFVTPIHKSDDKHDVTNYKDISKCLKLKSQNKYL